MRALTAAVEAAAEGGRAAGRPPGSFLLVTACDAVGRLAAARDRSVSALTAPGAHVVVTAMQARGGWGCSGGFGDE